MDALTPVQQQRLQRKKSRFVNPGFFMKGIVLLCFLLIPLLIPSFRVMDVMAKIMIFTILVASFDIILGYTGLLSLGHSMFFGLGAYSVAIVLYNAASPQWYHLLVATVLALILSASLALIISLFTLRVKAIFFAFMTLAMAEFARILAITWYDLTLGDNGISFELPGIFNVGWSNGLLVNAAFNGRLMTYYLILAVAVLLMGLMLRFVNSPLGRVLQSIRENEQRTTALGNKPFAYQCLSIVFGSMIASLAGILFAMWLRFVAPDPVLGIETVMLTVLLMVIIGGMGSIYGSLIGAAFVKIAETWLPDLQNLVAAVLPELETAHRLAERWVLYFGVLFVLVVFFFPKGFAGAFRERFVKRG